MTISPEALQAATQLDDGIDHQMLDDEAEKTSSRIVYFNGVVTKLALSLDNNPVAETTIRSLDEIRRGSGLTSGSIDVRNVSVDALEVDPGRYHLGVLAAALAVIRAYPRVEQMRIQPQVGSVDTIRGVALHLAGWREESLEDGEATTVSLVRDENLSRAA